MELNYTTLVFITPNALIGTEFDGHLYTAHKLAEHVGLSATTQNISEIFYCVANHAC